MNFVKFSERERESVCLRATINKYFVKIYQAYLLKIILNKNFKFLVNQLIKKIHQKINLKKKH
jgi:hypothetical protein